MGPSAARLDPATLSSPADEDSGGAWNWAFIAAAVTGLLLLLLFCSSLVTAIVRRRRARAENKEVAADDPVPASPRHAEAATR